jgi:hypothetical protein
VLLGAALVRQRWGPMSATLPPSCGCTGREANQIHGGRNGLERLAAFCPACHEVKHARLASKRGRPPQVVAHLSTVNGWTIEAAGLYQRGGRRDAGAGSRHAWTLNISLLSAATRSTRPTDGMANPVESKAIALHSSRRPAETALHPGRIPGPDRATRCVG